ncbi:MAG: hypothetical protein KDD43_04590 [Bdellovibrionales bacterium]|nr:hypothetical protein [Bdellovibrionales bacterium]
MSLLRTLKILGLFLAIGHGLTASAGGSGSTGGVGTLRTVEGATGIRELKDFDPAKMIWDGAGMPQGIPMYNAASYIKGRLSQFAGYVLDEKALANGEIAFMGEVKVKPQSGTRVIMWPNMVLDQAWEEIFSGKVEVPAHFGPNFKHSNWWNNVVDTTGQLKTAKDGDVVIAFREQVLEAIRRNEKPSVFVMPKSGISTIDMMMFYNSGSDQLIKFNQLHGIGQQK